MIKKVINDTRNIFLILAEIEGNGGNGNFNSDDKRNLPYQSI